MQVAVFHGPGQIAIEEAPEGELGDNDVRIAIARCGICGSDISMTSGSPFDYQHGKALGHEFAGEVIERGRSARKFKVGDKLAVLPSGPCGQCEMCRQGRPLFCTNGRNLFGGFGERMVLPERAGFMLPESVSLVEGALVEPMACGRRALRIGQMQRGDRVLVLGAGNIALGIIYWARLQGAGRIVVASRSARRDDIALAMGADAAVRLDDPDPEAATRVLGGLPDIVAECVGKPGMITMAIEKVRMGGAVLSMGMCSMPESIVPAVSTFKEVSLHFPLAYSIEDFTETIRAFDAGKVRPEEMVSTTIGLDELPDMIETMRGPHEHLKVQVAPNQA
ncbi:MAG: alcohol dehydrogenase catalytic domain-containing protein [Novosphingobium sp.]